MLDALPDLLTRQRHARALALAAIAALGVGLVAVLVQLTWLAVDVAAPPAPPASIASATPASSTAPAASLSRWHLFGNASPTGDNRALASNAPDTGLDLLLRGVFAGDDPRDGRAIIAAKDGSDERAVRPGDEVAPGVAIDSIYPDRVMLSRGGALEALRLPEPEARVTANAASARRGPLRNTSAAAPAPAPTASPPFVNPVMSLGGANLAQVGKGAGVDPQQIAQWAQQVSAAPVIEEGRIVGVRVQPGADPTLFARVGLQAGDVVTSVNGIALDSPARAQEIAQTLSMSGAARVTVRRGGKVETLTVSLR
ncbi:MAG TPA: type II secretion system protein N [Xanthomonadales bacterium]|nr:type II secretion system protein N [Xanthomonadales bacterium]